MLRQHIKDAKHAHAVAIVAMGPGRHIRERPPAVAARKILRLNALRRKLPPGMLQDNDDAYGDTRLARPIEPGASCV